MLTVLELPIVLCLCTGEVINLRSFPSLAGTPYGIVRRAFKEVRYLV